MPKMVDPASTVIRRSERLANKPRNIYNLFDKFSLSVVVACEVAKNPHIFLTRANHPIQSFNRHFYGTLNNYGNIIFAANQEQNNPTRLSTCCYNQEIQISFYP